MQVWSPSFCLSFLTPGHTATAPAGRLEHHNRIFGPNRSGQRGCPAQIKQAWSHQQQPGQSVPQSCATSTRLARQPGGVWAAPWQGRLNAHSVCMGLSHSTTLRPRCAGWTVSAGRSGKGLPRAAHGAPRGRHWRGVGLMSVRTPGDRVPGNAALCWAGVCPSSPLLLTP